MNPTTSAAFKPFYKIPGPYLRDPETKKLTDEMPLHLDVLATLMWDFYEKVDGTNIRVHWDGYSLYFAGRTDKAEIPKDLLAVLNEQFQEEVFEQFCGPAPLTVYGEGYGGKIQKGGGDYSPTPKFIAFDAMGHGGWQEPQNLFWLGRNLGFEVVPKVATATLDEVLYLVENVETPEWLFKSHLRDTPSEVVVCYPSLRLYDRSGNPICVKLKRDNISIS